MNEKIVFPDLVTLLSSKLNVTKKDAEAFLKEFFTVATEVIASGEELRIDGLGQFKPIWVESRSSINVQTGEPVEIPGHYKLSFLPDKVLRDAVNAPFSSFAVEILNDHVSIEEMLPPEESTALEEALPEITEEPVVVSTETPVEKDPVVVVVPEVECEPTVEEQEEIEEESTESSEELEEPFRHTRSHFWWGALSAVGMVALFVLAGGFWIYRTGQSIRFSVGEYSLAIAKEQIPDTATNTILAPIVTVEESDSLAVVAQDSLLTDTVVQLPVVVSEPVSKPVTKLEEKPESKQTIKPLTETIRSGVFLTTLSLKHFGHKAFWVYIYEENKAKIKNPDQIPVGTRVVIPEASKYGINAQDKASIDTAKALAVQIKQKYAQ